MRDQVILRIGAKVLIPLVMIFGFYVHFHGDYGPGGGFQAGVIIAAGFVLYGLVFGLDKLKRVLPDVVFMTLAPLGVMIYAGTGIVGLLMGGNYLDFNVLRYDPVAGQHLGILLVELGVVTTVFAVMAGLFVTFASRGRKGE